jgi:competence protein ComGC
MKHLIYIGALCLAMFAASSCGNQKKSEANGIDFKKYEIDSTYHLFGDAGKPAIKIFISMQYPEGYKNSAVLDSIQRLVISKVTTSANQASRNPEEAMRKFVEQQIEEYRLLEKDYEKLTEERIAEYNIMPNSFSYQYTGKEDNVFNKDGVFCFTNNVFQYTGGAHGLDRALYTCVDLENGTVITGEDLFVDDYESVLSPIILEKLLEIQKVKSPEELEKHGFLDIGDIKPNDNFYLNEKGITYVYNPYEIAAYFVGISEVFIPYEDINFILAAKSPIKKISK